MVYIILYLNQDSAFESYHPDHDMAIAWNGFEDTDSTDSEILEFVEYRFNMDHPPNYRNRSLSVGDVVSIDRRAYACERVGWRKLPMSPICIVSASRR